MRKVLLALVTLLVWQSAVTGQAPADPFAFFRPSVIVGADERGRLDRGETLVRVLGGGTNEVAIFAAVRVRVDGHRLSSWVREIAQLKKSTFVEAIERFSDPPQLEDLSALTLDDEDLQAIRQCRPGDCGLKLAASEIDTLRRVAAAQGDRKDALQDAFRHLMLERVRRYLADGQVALSPYADRDEPVSLATAFSSIVQHSPYLTERLPAFAEYLERYPLVPAPGVESFIYWSKERLAGKATVSATHISILRPGDEVSPEVLVAGKQIFATHYMDGSLNLTAVLGGSSETYRYLVYLNRSRVDILGRWFGGLARMMIERRVKGEASEVLQGLRRRLESGEPPAGRVPAVSPEPTPRVG